MKLLITATAIAGAMMTIAPNASAVEPLDTIEFTIPERAIMLNGSEGAEKGRDLVALLYDASQLHFHDPNAPRFLFVDREGRAALGIGGSLRATASYDFDGSIDNGPNFITYDIPTPNNAAQRTALFANANTSSLFLQLAGRSRRFGYYQLYVLTYFTGGAGPDSYGLKVDQAWMTVGALRFGLARTTFEDPVTSLNTIDFQGPSGAVDIKNVMVQYAPRFGRHFRAAVSLEMPQVSYTTTEGLCSRINQRVPDIPVYLQFDYSRTSHVRISAILRNLTYRNLVSGKNRYVTGYGVQLSGISSIVGGLSVQYQAAYGRGIASYFKDGGGNGLDLIADGPSGRMKAPDVLGVVGGLRYAFNSKLSANAGYSQMRVYGDRSLGADGYRSGQYIMANCFWNLLPELTVGVEYLHGIRTNIDGVRGRANRLEALVQYTF